MTKPLIGITRSPDGTPGSTDLNFSFYAQSIDAAGGEVRSIVFSEYLANISAILDEVDGLLFSGGDDLDPALYGQAWHPKAHKIDPRRQQFELALLAEAEIRKKPILGICLGCQLMNVHRGGSLIQFLPDAPRPTPLEHRKVNNILLRHDVTLETGSMLGETIGKTLINVNTYHKQAIDRVGRNLRIVGMAPDGVIEAIEDKSLPLFIGVQWHPERISTEPEQHVIFSLLIRAAASCRSHG